MNELQIYLCLLNLRPASSKSQLKVTAGVALWGWQGVGRWVLHFKQHVVRVGHVLLRRPPSYVRFFVHLRSELESLLRCHDNEEVSCLTVHPSFVSEQAGQLWGNFVS